MSIVVMMMRSLLMIPVQGSRLAGSRTVRRKHAFARPEKYATGVLVVAWKIGQSVVSISFCVLHSELVFFYFIFFSLLFSRKKFPRKNLILSFSTSSFSGIFSFKTQFFWPCDGKLINMLTISRNPNNQSVDFLLLRGTVHHGSCSAGPAFRALRALRANA